MRIQPDWLTNLSLDAPVVGTLWLALFAKGYRTPVGNELLWLLFSSIWLIYVVDRIVEWDYARMQERHNFHQKHRRVFLMIAAVIALLNAWMIWQFPLMPELYRSAAIVGSGAVIYLLLSYLALDPPAKEWGKNILVSVLFAMGCTLPIWTILAKESRLTASFGVELFSLALLIFCNLRFIESDESDRKTIPWEIGLASLIILACTAITRNLLTLAWFLSLLLMTCVRLARFHRYSRTAYDIALILPAFVLYII